MWFHKNGTLVIKKVTNSHRFLGNFFTGAFGFAFASTARDTMVISESLPGNAAIAGSGTVDGLGSLMT